MNKTVILRAPIRISFLRGSRPESRRASTLFSATQTPATRFQQRIQPRQNRPFTTTVVCLKKSKPKDDTQSQSKTPLGDPFDFSILEDSLSNVRQKCKDDLTKLRVGGRTDPTALENIKVQIGKDKASPGGFWYNLGDLGQVVIRGRGVSVLVGEKEHVKAITTALQSTPQELTPPRQSPENPLELLMNLPPVTQESRQQTVKAAQALGQNAQNAVQAARATQLKRLQGMSSESAGNQDDVKRAKDLMEKVVLKGRGDVEKLVAESKRFLEKG
ncbi:MAG: hypothetical protein M1828_005362 [Chrysothrix sp. TS-e1954]|nr:MAG: hypothetical protein M1828_005362 [Chrysothrix sp. TS-e1954]